MLTFVFMAAVARPRLESTGYPWNFNDPKHKGSFLVCLLPYMKRNDLFGSLDFTSGTQDIENQLVGGKALYTVTTVQ